MVRKTEKNPRGAGRKPTGNARKQISIRINQQIYDLMRESETPISDAINTMLLEQYGK